MIADGDGGSGGAQSQGNVVAAGDGIELVSSSFQGALIANKSVGQHDARSDQGPMVSVYNRVYSGQTGDAHVPDRELRARRRRGVTEPAPAGALLPAVDFG